MSPSRLFLRIAGSPRLSASIVSVEVIIDIMRSSPGLVALSAVATGTVWSVSLQLSGSNLYMGASLEIGRRGVPTSNLGGMARDMVTSPSLVSGFTEK